jgi:hypothetical protein
MAPPMVVDTLQRSTGLADGLLAITDLLNALPEYFDSGRHLRGGWFHLRPPRV